MGFSIVYKKLIFKVIKIAFRIRCIMLILDFIHNYSIDSIMNFIFPPTLKVNTNCTIK